MRPSVHLASLLCLLTTTKTQAKLQEKYYESLTLTPLRDGRVLSSFSFDYTLPGLPRDPRSLDRADEPQHYALFPLSLGQILRTHAVSELHLTLAAGRWQPDAWGLPSDLSSLGALGTAGELRAWMGDGGLLSVDERWRGLTNSLSGLFCASLSRMDEKRTTSPVKTFAPGSLPLFGEQQHNSSVSDSSATNPSGLLRRSKYHLRHATLPSENVCTENLTPFIKLLPCSGKSGLSELLAPHRLFDADWHSLAVHVGWSPDNGGEVRLKLGFNAVFNPVRTSRDEKRDWSLSSLFSRPITRACPASRSSNVKVQLAQHSSLLPPLSQEMISSDGFASYAVSSQKMPLDVSLKFPSETAFSHPDHAQAALGPISVDRVLTTTDQTKGTLHIRVTNNLDSAQDVGYTELLPWLVMPYLHTLKVTVDGIPAPDALTLLTYIPTQGSRPTTLETTLRLPPRGVLRLVMDVDKRFLKYTEHPPDAQRGWDLPGAIFTLGTGANWTVEGPRHYLHTRPLLMDLATPDFSMPYNVIIMSSTLLTLLFGNVLNMLVREFKVVDLSEEKKEDAEGVEGKEKKEAVSEGKEEIRMG